MKQQATKKRQQPKQDDQTPVRRFTSYEEFQKAFYPDSSKPEIPVDNIKENCDFGALLATESLNRHAAVLKF